MEKNLNFILVAFLFFKVIVCSEYTVNNPDLIVVVGQNDNLTLPAGAFGSQAVTAFQEIQNWNMTQVYWFYNEARNWYGSQFGIFFPENSINSPYFAMDTTGRAILMPLVATGKYRLFGVLGDHSILPELHRNDMKAAPIWVELIEYVVNFDLSSVIPNWTFSSWNYGGVYSQLQNGEGVAVLPSDSLSFGIYKIGQHNFYMRTPVPNRTTLNKFHTSLEAAQFCSTDSGAGLSSMRVDAFAFSPNQNGTYPTSTTASWHFFKNPNRAAFPALYQFAPKVFPGRESPSCLANI